MDLNFTDNIFHIHYILGLIPHEEYSIKINAATAIGYAELDDKMWPWTDVIVENTVNRQQGVRFVAYGVLLIWRFWELTYKKYTMRIIE